MNRLAWEEKKKRNKVIVDCLGQGLSVHEASKKFNQTESAIRYIAEPYELTKRKDEMKTKLENMVKDFRCGMSEQRLAQKYHKQAVSVSAYLRRKVKGYRTSFSRGIKARNSRLSSLYPVVATSYFISTEETET